MDTNLLPLLSLSVIFKIPIKLLDFIDTFVLVDLPLVGRSFTWFRGDSKSMSQLDRFLLSETWCLTWPNCVHVVRLRSLSDHCPISLSLNEDNWGPKPFHMLHCWTDVPRYKQVAQERWNSFQVKGWGSYGLKQKLKLMKIQLKGWHQKHSKNIPAKKKSLKELCALTDELHSLSRVHSSICCQQSRLNWLREGKWRSQKK